MTADDLAKHASTWVDPIGMRYRGHDVWELPPALGAAFGLLREAEASRVRHAIRTALGL